MHTLQGPDCDSSQTSSESLLPDVAATASQGDIEPSVRNDERRCQEINVIEITSNGWKRNRKSRKEPIVQTPNPSRHTEGKKRREPESGRSGLTMEDMGRRATAALRAQFEDNSGTCSGQEVGNDQNLSPSSSNNEQRSGGCLFAQCLRCPQMIRATFSTGVIPSLPKAPDTNSSNGIVMTLCRSCDTGRNGRNYTVVQGEDKIFSDCAKHFKALRMDIRLFAGLDIVSAAAFIVDRPVAFYTVNGSPMFVNRYVILKLVTPSDELASIRECETGPRWQLVPLCGGFF